MELGTLDESDLATLVKLQSQGGRVLQLEQQAIEAKIEHRGAEKFFYASIAEKYGLGERDEITQAGDILRKSGG